MNAASNLETQGNATHHHRYGSLSYAIMNDGSSKKPDMDLSGRPAPGERAIVRCHGFQCLAYRDSQGRWREASDKRLLEVLEVVLRL